MPGRDYRDGELVVKFAPDVAVYGKSGAGLAGPRRGAALTSQASLNRVLGAHGITQLDAVFPNAGPPVQTMSAGSRTAQPDLTRWFRAKTSGATGDHGELLTVDWTGTAFTTTRITDRKPPEVEPRGLGR